MLALLAPRIDEPIQLHLLIEEEQREEQEPHCLSCPIVRTGHARLA